MEISISAGQSLSLPMSERLSQFQKTTFDKVNVCVYYWVLLASVNSNLSQQYF